jgi:hypothetical protein
VEGRPFHIEKARISEIHTIHRDTSSWRAACQTLNLNIGATMRKGEMRMVCSAFRFFFGRYLLTFVGYLKRLKNVQYVMEQSAEVDGRVKSGILHHTGSQPSMKGGGSPTRSHYSRYLRKGDKTHPGAISPEHDAQFPAGEADADFTYKEARQEVVEDGNSIHISNASTYHSAGYIQQTNDTNEGSSVSPRSEIGMTKSRLLGFQC